MTVIKPVKKTSFYVLLGYLLIFILALGSTIAAYSLEKRLQSSVHQLDQHFLQKDLVEQLYQNARDRSIILFRITVSQDIFDVDQLAQELSQKAQNIILTIEAYTASNITPQEEQILNRLIDVTNLNREKQNQVSALALDARFSEAQTLLVNETLPIQDSAIQLFEQLYSIKDQQLAQARQQVYQDIQAIKSLWGFTIISLFILLGLISLITLRKLGRAQSIQQDFQHELEQKVTERTKEIVLDSAILQNIHESIAITTEKGEMIKTNLKFKTLVTDFQLDHEFYIWSVLDKLFYGLDNNKLYEQVTQEGQARQEAILQQDENRHFLVDVYKIDDVRLDYPYLSFLFTDITHLKQTQNELESLANYDNVTGLANRYLFQSTLKTWIKDQTPFSVFFLDLDNFKWVNDTQGHAAGDKVLEQVAQLLNRLLPDQVNNLVARLGGDEFAILCRKCDELSIAKLANELIDGIRLLYQSINPSQTLGCSIGIANYPKDGKSLEDLMRHADFAMYKAKEQGKNGYCLFSDKMNEHIHYLYETEINLHQALLKQEFFLVYQPQYCLKTLEVVGAEALIRWQKGDRQIPPNEFIPLAEKFGLIRAIGGFVLEQALAQLHQWQQQQKGLERIAINVSSAQLNGHGFIDHIKQQLEQHQLQPHQLDIEITESLLMDHLSEDNQALYALQQKGLEISIDDFGTGYSSLAYIKHLNVDRIKIDQSFIRDLDYNAESYSIVSAIITMGHSLGMKVLAEGIETKHQLEILRQLGCDEGQGYLLSRPSNAEQVNFNRLTFDKD